MTSPPLEARTLPGVLLPQPTSVAELAARLGGEPDAQASHRRVAAVCSPEQAFADPARGEACLVLVTARARAETARATRAVLLCAEELTAVLPAGVRWPHRTPMWVVAQLLGPSEPGDGRLHPTAVVHESAVLGEGVTVRAGAVVQAGVRIGDASIIGEKTVICTGATIGSRTRIGPHALIGREGFGWASGPAGELVRIPQRGGVSIGDDVEIGPFCSVDAGTLGPTLIMDRVRLDAHVHVGHNVEIGPDTLVAAQSGFAGSVRVGRGVLVGGQAGFADHVRVGDGARIAAQSGVIGSVPAGAVVAGFPAVPKAQLFRALARLLRRP